MFEVKLADRSIEPFADLVDRSRIEALRRSDAEVRGLMGSGSIWNVNSTAAGGGVAEMLHSLLGYSRGLGIPTRWLVIEGQPEFFAITKRLHNALHDSAGDGTELGAPQRAVYERVLRDNAAELDRYVHPGDVVVLHDPQTAGLVPHLAERGIHVVWRCHIGQEGHGAELERGWAFLRPYVEDAPLVVFTRKAYAPPWLPQVRTFILAPTIDPFSAKNVPMKPANVRAILSAVGLLDGGDGDSASFLRDDGSVGQITHAAEVLRWGGKAACDVPLVVQVSRWDRMKDPLGVLDGFVRYVAQNSRPAELVLAGPSLDGVADDPEGPEVFREVELSWRALPESTRHRVHLAQLPMKDAGENAAIVNALQRHAAVVVQKSLMEGFGLTVTEAMWKRRPVVASAVGGIQDQIRDGVDGILIQDPRDPAELGDALHRVLADELLAHRLGEAAYKRVRDGSININGLESFGKMLQHILEHRPLIVEPELVAAARR